MVKGRGKKRPLSVTFIRVIRVEYGFSIDGYYDVFICENSLFFNLVLFCIKIRFKGSTKVVQSDTIK